jgi:hypothetical protein
MCSNGGGPTSSARSPQGRPVHRAHPDSTPKLQPRTHPGHGAGGRRLHGLAPDDALRVTRFGAAQVRRSRTCSRANSPSRGRTYRRLRRYRRPRADPARHCPAGKHRRGHHHPHRTALARGRRRVPPARGQLRRSVRSRTHRRARALVQRARTSPPPSHLPRPVLPTGSRHPVRPQRSRGRQQRGPCSARRVDVLATPPR